MLCLFLGCPVSVLHHSVHLAFVYAFLFLSSPPSFLLLSPSVESCSSNVSNPVLLPCSNYIHDMSFSSTFFNPSSFVLCSVQLILSIILHIHILYYNYNIIITALTATAVARAEAFLSGHLSWHALVWRRH